MFFKRFCVLVLWTKVALALEGLRLSYIHVVGTQLALEVYARMNLLNV